MGISPFKKLAWYLQGLPVRRLCDNAILIEEHRLPVSLDDLIEHHRSGGNIDALVDAAIAAPKEDLQANLPRLFSADLRGLDLLDFINRGYRSEGEAAAVQQREAASHDINAAEARYVHLLESLQKLDRAMEEADDDDTMAGYAHQRERIEEEIDALLKRHPGLDKERPDSGR